MKQDLEHVEARAELLKTSAGLIEESERLRGQAEKLIRQSRDRIHPAFDSSSTDVVDHAGN